MPAASYLPFIGELTGGLNIEAQQLSVVLSPGGRVLRYEMHSSRDKPRDAFAGSEPLVKVADRLKRSRLLFRSRSPQRQGQVAGPELACPGAVGRLPLATPVQGRRG